MKEENEEGKRAVEQRESPKTKTNNTEPLKIDKRKLVIYSEIMKPKFDE